MITNRKYIHIYTHDHMSVILSMKNMGYPLTVTMCDVMGEH